MIGDVTETATRGASGARLWTPLAISILGFIGLGISSYLTYTSLTGVVPACLPASDCGAVLASPYARALGVPVSLFGIVLYAVLTGLGLSLLQERKKGRALVALGVYAGALAGTLYSAYLTYAQVFEIHGLCIWCLASAIVVAAILALSLIILLSGPSAS
ncbi:MAG: vitamin K epoxide reductase family protein [Chloroflexota bacterium]|nr:vitamin K epoxide reductase family protein [Chloroflexota bacterium]